MNTHTLIGHSDIQNWVTARRGQPAIARAPDRAGNVRARLLLNFKHHVQAPRDIPSQDDGMSPVSWSAWLAELDRQNLALKVFDKKQPAYEFVPRAELN